mgnify:CR=1 FL=1
MHRGMLPGTGEVADALDVLFPADARIVWSPSSNFALYGPGVTAPIQDILQQGIVTGLGPDWTLSGEDEMLGDVATRGMLMEATTASVLLTAGADVLVMRHPEAIKLVRQLMTDLGVK